MAKNVRGIVIKCLAEFLQGFVTEGPQVGEKAAVVIGVQLSLEAMGRNTPVSHSCKQLYT